MTFTNIHKMNIIVFLRRLTFFGAVSVPFFLYWGGLNYTQIFILQAWFMFWIFVFELPTGGFADVFGRKKSMFLSSIINVIAFLIYASVPNFYVFLFAEFLGALSIAFMTGADKAFIYDTLKEDRLTRNAREVFSKYASFGTLGIIVALPVGSFIASLELLPYPRNLMLPMALTSIPMFLAAIVSLFLKEPEMRNRIKLDNYFSTVKKGFLYFINHRILKILAFDFISISTLTFFIFWFYQSLFDTLKVNIFYYGLVGAAFNLFGILLLLNLKRLGVFFGKKRLLFLSALIPGILYIILGLHITLVTTVVSTFLIIGLRVIREPLFDNYMNRYIPSRQRATVLSSISTFERMVMIAVYPTVGVLADWSLQNTFLVLGVATVLFALISRTEEGILV